MGDITLATECSDAKPYFARTLSESLLFSCAAPRPLLTRCIVALDATNFQAESESERQIVAALL